MSRPPASTPPAGPTAPIPPAASLPQPSLRLRLDAAALAANWRALDRLSGAAATGAAVKADGYGLGAARVVPVLHEAGCRDFFVAHWRETEPLLGLLDPARLSVLHGPLTDEDCAFARARGVKPVLNSLEQAARWVSASGGRCDLMVDTGINRLGVPLAALGDPLIARLGIDVCMSHLASADEDTPQNEAQRAAFEGVRSAVPAARYSLANSAGIALGASYHADLTRPGLSLYGGIARPELAEAIAPVAHPEAALLQVRELAPGAPVGYNATFVAERPMRVGIVSLGYADGYLRAWSGVGSMRLGDAPLPVIGRVSMDLTIVDLSAAPDAREGDWVTIDYRLPDAAAATGLSQYELLTLLGARFAR